MKKLAVVAFGGNALLRHGNKGTFAEQLENVKTTCESLMPLLKQGYDLVLGHGNGPQVGNVMLQHAGGKSQFGIEAMPLDFCVAETQGSIGYLIELGFRDILQNHGMNKQIVTLVTQVLVDKNDPAFQNPVKPVGLCYTKEEADAFSRETGAVFHEDPKGNGWRKVVASPVPIDILNVETVSALAHEGKIVVTAGGGGIPVCKDGNHFYGLEAVIDKDLASALTAVKIKADEFYILTDVEKIYINFRKPNEQALNEITVSQAKQYLAEGHFAEGSMAPKVRAAIFFIEHGGKECVITEAGQLGNPHCGTRIMSEK